MLATEKLTRKIRKALPRRFQIYCVGAAKTGTTTLAAMFGNCCRSAHEPETEETNDLIISWLEKQIGDQELREMLLARDRRLKLEFESAHPLGYAAPVLAETFPRAKFVVTMREPGSWLRSRLNFHYRVDPPEWRSYRDYFWGGRHRGFADEERALEELGLFSLDAYLSQYAEQYRTVFGAVPADRLLVIRTAEIDTSIEELADFAGVKGSRLRLARSKVSKDKIDPLQDIDAEFVRSRIWAHCGDLIREYFPARIANYR